MYVLIKKKEIRNTKLKKRISKTISFLKDGFEFLTYIFFFPIKKLYNFIKKIYAKIFW
jgi:hypothetical protein